MLDVTRRPCPRVRADGAVDPQLGRAGRHEQEGRREEAAPGPERGRARRIGPAAAREQAAAAGARHPVKSRGLVCTGDRHAAVRALPVHEREPGLLPDCRDGARARRVQGGLLCLAAAPAVGPCRCRRGAAEARPDRPCQFAPDLRGAPRPCRSAGAWREARSQTDRAADARGGAGRRQPSAWRSDHDAAGQGRPAGARPGGPRLHARRGPEPAVGRRHHLCADGGGVPLSGCRAGRLEPQDRRLVDGQPPARRAGAGCDGNGGGPAAAERRHPPQRPRQPRRIQLVVATPRGGSCDGGTKAAFGSVWSGAIVVAGSTAGGGARGAADGFGHRLRRVCRARMRRSGRACRRLSDHDGSGRQAACHQQCFDDRRSRSPGDICRLRNGRSLRFCVRRAWACGRLPGRSGGRRRRSRESCGATRRRAAAVWSIGRPRRNGMPSGRRGGRSLRSWRSTRRCGRMCRIGWPAWS